MLTPASAQFTTTTTTLSDWSNFSEICLLTTKNFSIWATLLSEQGLLKMVPWVVFKGLVTPEINAKWCTWIHMFFFLGAESNNFYQILKGDHWHKNRWSKYENQPTNVPVRIKNPFVYKILFCSLQNKPLFRSSFALFNHLTYGFYSS